MQDDPDADLFAEQGVRCLDAYSKSQRTHTQGTRLRSCADSVMFGLDAIAVTRNDNTLSRSLQ